MDMKSANQAQMAVLTNMSFQEEKNQSILINSLLRFNSLDFDLNMLLLQWVINSEELIAMKALSHTAYFSGQAGNLSLNDYA